MFNPAQHSIKELTGPMANKRTMQRNLQGMVRLKSKFPPHWGSRGLGEVSEV